MLRTSPAWHCTRVAFCKMLLVIMSVGIVHGTLVTVQSQTQEQMDALTQAVNLAAASDHTGGARVTLGTIEATMSRVVDIESEFLVTVPQSVQTLRLLNAIEFDSETQMWHLAYEVMGREEGSSVNQFVRTLYFTKLGNAHTGDHENACLSAEVADAQCLQLLAANYIVPLETLSAATDQLEFGVGSSFASSGIRSTLTPQSASLIETLDVFIPHSVVKAQLARREVRTSATFGEQTQYTFGVGVLFLQAGLNTILFDSFQLIENAHAQALLTKTVSYSVAKHVSFFTEVLQGDSRVRLVSVEYLVEAGHVLHAITASVNGHDVTLADCARARTRIAAFASSGCLAARSICQIETYTPPGSASGEVWVTYTMPIPAVVGASDDTLLVNTLLDTRDTNTGTQLFSSINFQTPNSPRPVCTDIAVTAFNPTLFGRAVLYESMDLHAQELTSSTHTMANVTVDGIAALTMADALLTLVLAPGAASGSLEYFEQNALEGIRLDEVYMSHAKPEVRFGTVRNTMASVSVGGASRTGVVLDSGLLQQCPLESGPRFVYGHAAFDCVTTQDYGFAGALKRPVSGVNTNFVYEVTGGDSDLAWLRSNIFGDSFAGRMAATDFIARVHALVPDDRKAHARTFWIWPLYAWPTEAPVGLKDKTLLSLAWSIGEKLQATGAVARRLLQESAVRPLSRVRLFDLYRRRIDVGALRRTEGQFKLTHTSNSTGLLPEHRRKRPMLQVRVGTY